MTLGTQQLTPIIANYCSLPSLSFGQALGKLQGKVVTHSEEVGWWRALMVEYVTPFIWGFNRRLEKPCGIGWIN